MCFNLKARKAKFNNPKLFWKGRTKKVPNTEVSMREGGSSTFFVVSQVREDEQHVEISGSKRRQTEVSTESHRLQTEIS